MAAPDPGCVGEANEKNVEKWQKVVGDHPTFVAAIARHHVAGRPHRGSRAGLEAFHRALARPLGVPGPGGNLPGTKATWAERRKTLDEFLTKVEDHGLDHAKVRVAIADDLMTDGHYEEAWPYAVAAAQTWAGWAMTCAQNCAEGLKNWEAAEGYARASSDATPGACGPSGSSSASGPGTAISPRPARGPRNSPRTSSKVPTCPPTPCF